MEDIHEHRQHRHGRREHPRRRHGGFGGPFDGPPGPPPFGPPGRGRRGRGRHGGRSKRGDIRAALLTLLSEQPRHGYEIIGEIAERSDGLWRPSPGSVYPTLQLLADEGLVQSEEQGGKRLFELTDEGREAASKLEGKPPWEQMTSDADPVDLELREASRSLLGAIRQVGRVATSAQKARAVAALKTARKELYTILSEDDPE